MDDNYIPKNLEECFDVLNAKLNLEDIDKIKSISEEAMAMYHHGFGTVLRNNWGLWTDSELRDWFLSRGIKHADDMSGIILTSYWRRLHEQPLELETQIKFYQDFWKNSKD